MAKLKKKIPVRKSPVKEEFPNKKSTDVRSPKGPGRMDTESGENEETPSIPPYEGTDPQNPYHDVQA